MTRLRYNGLSTTLGASLTSSATALTFAAALTHSGGTAVPTIGAGDSIPLSILDLTGKLSEVVYLTAYTAGATTGTITRAQEGTTGVSHASGDRVVHGPLVSDVPGGLTQSYLGETATSATWTTFVGNRIYCKQITLASAGLLAGVSVYIDSLGAAGTVTSMQATLHEHDPSGGATDQIGLVRQTSPAAQTYLARSGEGRWVNLSFGNWLAAGTYWIGVQSNNTAFRLNVGNATGTDRTFQPTGYWVPDGIKGGTGYPISAASGVSWSIRATILS